MPGTQGLFSFIVSDNPYYDWVASAISIPYCSSLWYEDLFEEYATAPLMGSAAPTATVASIEPTMSLPPAWSDFTYSAAIPRCSTCILFCGDVEVCEYYSFCSRKTSEEDCAISLKLDPNSRTELPFSDMK